MLVESLVSRCFATTQSESSRLTSAKGVIPALSAPKLYIDVVMLRVTLGFLDSILGEGDGRSIKVLTQGDVSQREDRGSNVGVGCDEVHILSLWHAGAANQEGHVDVFLNGASLSWLQTMLSNVETIVRREDDVGVVEDTGLIKTLNDGVDHFINGLQCLETAAVVVVTV